MSSTECEIKIQKEYNLGRRETARTQERYVKSMIKDEGLDFVSNYDHIEVNCR